MDDDDGDFLLNKPIIDFVSFPPLLFLFVVHPFSSFSIISSLRQLRSLPPYPLPLLVVYVFLQGG